ncbi:MAG: GNAT family N-acetyltransferase [Candidatus Saccharibacteria bacterium]
MNNQYIDNESNMTDKEMNNNTIVNPEIKLDDQLTIRLVKPEEATELFNLMDANRDYLGQWLPFIESTTIPQDSLQFINETIENFKNGSSYGFGIILDEKLIGHASLMHIKDDHEPEIGYWISKDHSGKGIATRLTEFLTNLGFDELGLKKIIITANKENIGSNRIAEKLGYTIERTKPGEMGGIDNIWVKTNR